MELNDFTRVAASAFENGQSITPQTRFRDNDEWCSIVAMTLIAMVRKAYKVTLKPEDLRSSQTIGDLYNIVKNR